MRHLLISSGCFCALILAGCGQRKVVRNEDFVKTVEGAASKEPKALWAWSYEGDKGPGKWAALNPEYGTCASGKRQSPIDLIWRKPSGENPLTVTYRPTDINLSNTGYTFRIEFTPQSQVTYKNQDYLLEKAEIRTPSEHRFSGKKLPLEIQFYHRSPNGLRQAMISLLAVQGKASEWFESFLDIASKTAAYGTSETVRIDPGLLIPKPLTFYHYKGSLTHPPCLEGVDWFIVNTPIQLSAQQIARFKALYNNNNRPLQKINGRKVNNY